MQWLYCCIYCVCEREGTGHSWWVLQGVLGSGVILALLSIKLNQPAGRTENPVLHPSVSQGLLFPEYLCWLLFPPLILFSSHSQNQKTSPRASPAKRDVSESPGWGWPRTGWEKGREGRMMLVSPSGELSWLWEADGKTNILCVWRRGALTGICHSEQGWTLCLELLAVFVGLLPKRSVLVFATQGWEPPGTPVNGAQESSKPATFHSSVEITVSIITALNPASVNAAGVGNVLINWESSCSLREVPGAALTSAHSVSVFTHRFTPPAAWLIYIHK